jgi:D-glycero-D-manno-heptose 1,7-bisphosphate phosphatase
MKKPVVFLDRDGVINHDSADYIKTPDEFEFIPNSPEAIAFLCEQGFDVMVMTNQSMIGRQMASIQTLMAIFKKMNQGVNAAGGEIKDIFYCPHLPDAGCRCRKPAPGLFLSAREKYGLALSDTAMIGDSTKDIQAGQNAGCRTTILVQTGSGRTARVELAQKQIFPTHVAADLYDAAAWLVEHHRVL